MPFFDLSQQPTRTIFPGVTITTAWGDEVMLSFVRFEYEGAVVPEHQHPHEQMGVGLEGEFALTIGDETRLIRAGDSYWIPSNTPHSARSVQGPARALDIFHPIRDDYR
ncbi:MAG TPA: cupin domain-containing protein [Chthonomonadaceae bacterium]|jgi:quercetin dioxygenase-like cupin family protein|nr:cupin domain-containing protein [Chthonomonadaceae bacterium]